MTGDVNTEGIEAIQRRALRITLISLVVLAVALVVAAIFAFVIFPRTSAGRVKGESAQTERRGSSVRPTGEDYVHDMDGGVQLTADDGDYFERPADGRAGAVGCRQPSCSWF